MKWDEQASAASNANRVLPVLAREFFKAGRDAVKARRTPDELHQFRVHAKRFRYALEMFAPVYGPELEQRTGVLQQLQKTMGKISDTYTIRELLEHHGGYKNELQAEGKKHIAEFRNYWKHVFDAPGEKRGWISALGRAGSTSKEDHHEEEALDNSNAGDVGATSIDRGRLNGNVGGQHNAPERG